MLCGRPFRGVRIGSDPPVDRVADPGAGSVLADAVPGCLRVYAPALFRRVDACCFRVLSGALSGVFRAGAGDAVAGPRRVDDLFVPSVAAYPAPVLGAGGVAGPTGGLSCVPADALAWSSAVASRALRCAVAGVSRRDRRTPSRVSSGGRRYGFSAFRCTALRVVLVDLSTPSVMSLGGRRSCGPAGGRAGLPASVSVTVRGRVRALAAGRGSASVRVRAAAARRAGPGVPACPVPRAPGLLPAGPTGSGSSSGARRGSGVPPGSRHGSSGCGGGSPIGGRWGSRSLSRSRSFGGRRCPRLRSCSSRQRSTSSW